MLQRKEWGKNRGRRFLFLILLSFVYRHVSSESDLSLLPQPPHHNPNTKILCNFRTARVQGSIPPGGAEHTKVIPTLVNQEQNIIRQPFTAVGFLKGRFGNSR